MYSRCFSTVSSKPLKHYDCIITGGGMIGSTLACSLSETPILKDKKVLLIEAGQEKEQSLPPFYSNRVSALNTSTKELFVKNGMWKNIESARFQTVKYIKVWGHSSPNNTQFADSRDENIAYIVENDVIMNSGHKELRSRSNVDILYNSVVDEVQLPKGSNAITMPQVKLENSVYSCQLLVGADGVRSKVRSSMNPHYISWNYNQSAVVATLQVAADDESNNTAWQRFLPDGPIAVLPLNNRTSSLVWSTTTEKANTLLALTSEEFVNAVNDALVSPSKKDAMTDFTGNAIDTILRTFSFNIQNSQVNPPFVETVEEKSRASFPLGFGHSSKYVAQSTVLIGDAAHRVHPLAGQGVNLGFSDIRYLCEALMEGAKLGRTFGDSRDLLTYEQFSQKHNIPIMLAIDFLHRLYVSEIGGVRAIGDAFFKIAEAVKPIKGTMKKFASGSI